MKMKQVNGKPTERDLFPCVVATLHPTSLSQHFSLSIP